MGLLSKLKSMLGVGSEERSRGGGVDVTVEREPAAESERAAKEPAEETKGEAVEEPVAADADASASTESLVDEEHTDDPTRAAEPGEAAIAEGEASADVEESEGESVSVVKGIGPAYAERLEEVGVETVADLADADPEDLAERADLSAKRVGRWVERAQDRE